MTTNALMELARKFEARLLDNADVIPRAVYSDLLKIQVAMETQLRTAASGVGEPAAWLCEWQCPYSDETARVTFEHKRGADSRAEEVGLMLGVEARVLPLYLHPGAEARDAELATDPVEIPRRIHESGAFTKEAASEAFSGVASRRCAERYRWLRDSSPEEIRVRVQGSNPVHPHLWAYYSLSGEALDAAIDAALRAREGIIPDKKMGR